MLDDLIPGRSSRVRSILVAQLVQWRPESFRVTSVVGDCFGSGVPETRNDDGLRKWNMLELFVEGEELI